MATPVPVLNFSNFAEAYEGMLVGPLFRPWAELLVDQARIAPGDRVLDIACGTGIVARLARERVGREGQVVGVDQNAQMLAVARTADARIDWREGSASALPVDATERFDVVTCQQGIQFFADKQLAVAEMHRVLAPGGRVAIGVWRPDDESPVLLELRRVAERHVGSLNDVRHSFGDDRALRNLLEDGGFSEVRVEAKRLPIRFADRSAFVRLNAMALVGMSPKAKTLTDEQRASIVATIVRESEGVLPGGPGAELTYEIGSNVALGRA